VDALIFDFDGVVIDSEPTHLMCFRQVLDAVGIDLKTEDYYGRYLGLDDHDCFARVLEARGRPADESQIRRMIARKTACIQEAYAGSIRAMPGAVELARRARQAGIPTAVCSGGLRKEIELAARAIGAGDLFMTIVSAQDVRRGKPDPEGYRLALGRLRRLSGRRLRPSRSLVIEDAPAGIQAARAAGMKVLALTSSYPPGELARAQRVVGSLADVSLDDLEEILEP
jgi:beta-phosphoglucomutase